MIARFGPDTEKLSEFVGRDLSEVWDLSREEWVRRSSGQRPGSRSDPHQLPEGAGLAGSFAFQDAPAVGLGRELARAAPHRTIHHR